MLGLSAHSVHGTQPCIDDSTYIDSHRVVYWDTPQQGTNHRSHRLIDWLRAGRIKGGYLPGFRLSRNSASYPVISETVVKTCAQWTAARSMQ